MEKYRILESLAQTDNAEIFLVKNTENNRIYVMKRLKKGDTEAYENMRGINNPHIVRVYEVSADTVILEYIPGIALSRLGRRAAEYEVRDWVLQLCSGLEELHRNGIIHRDIKPSNIILTDDGVIKLIDFDISRTYKRYRGKDTCYIGTDGYAPPEQYGFAQTDERSDIYAVGAMMFELLTGGKALRDLGEYNGLLRPVIEKCTRLAPQERYQSIAELQKALGGAAAAAKPPETSKTRLKPAALCAVIVTALLAAVIAGAAVMPRVVKSIAGIWVTEDRAAQIRTEYGDYNEASVPVGVSAMRLETTEGAMGGQYLKLYVKLTDNGGVGAGARVGLQLELLDGSGTSLGFEEIGENLTGGGNVMCSGTVYAHMKKDGSYEFNDGTVAVIRISNIKIK